MTNTTVSPLRSVDLSDLVNIAEIARRLDKKQPNVHAMTKTQGFPEPMHGPSVHGALFSWIEISAWLDAKADKRRATLQKQVDAAERAAKRADKAAKAAEEAKARLAQIEAETKTDDDDEQATLDLGLDLDDEDDPDFEFLNEGDALAAAMADFEDEEERTA